MPSENVEIVRGIFAAWERGDFSSTEWADPEIEFSIPGPDPKVYRGVEDMGRAWAEWLNAWKGFSVEARDFIEAGDSVVVKQQFGGEGRASGLPVAETEGAAVLTLRDGKVVRFRGYTTLKGALEDAGIDP